MNPDSPTDWAVVTQRMADERLAALDREILIQKTMEGVTGLRSPSLGRLQEEWTFLRQFMRARGFKQWESHPPKGRAVLRSVD